MNRSRFHVSFSRPGASPTFDKSFNMKSSKLKATLDSRNFFVSLVSIAMLVLTSQGVQIDLPADQVVDIFMRADVVGVLSVIVPNLLNPIMKIAKTGFSWAFLKSKNFWVQAGTFIILALSGLGIVFPDGAAASIVDTVFQGNAGAIVTALVVNLANPIYHFVFDRDQPLLPNLISKNS